jgi:hypothetical protein
MESRVIFVDDVRAARIWIVNGVVNYKFYNELLEEELSDGVTTPEGTVPLDDPRVFGALDRRFASSSRIVVKQEAA